MPDDVLRKDVLRSDVLRSQASHCHKPYHACDKMDIACLGSPDIESPELKAQSI